MNSKFPVKQNSKFVTKFATNDTSRKSATNFAENEVVSEKIFTGAFYKHFGTVRGS